MRKCKACGFTLIELLVVIAIISLLVSILMPTLQRATVLARRVVCAAQIHHIAIGIHGYVSDNNEIMPCRQYGDVWLPDTGGPQAPWTQNLGLVWKGLYIGEGLYGDGRVFFDPDAQETPGWHHIYSEYLAMGGEDSRANFANPNGHVYSRITYAYRYHPEQSSGYMSYGWTPPVTRLGDYPFEYSTWTVRAWVSCLQASLDAPYPMRVVSHRMDGCNTLYHDGSLSWVDNPSSDRSGPGEIANYHPLGWFGGGWWWAGLADDAYPG